MTADEDGDLYAREVRVETDRGPALVTVERFRKVTRNPGAWSWAVYSVRPADDPGAAPVALERLGRGRWAIGALTFTRRRDAAGFALKVGRLRSAA